MSNRFRIQTFFPEPKSCDEALKMMTIGGRPHPNDVAVIYYNKNCINNGAINTKK